MAQSTPGGTVSSMGSEKSKGLDSGKEPVSPQRVFQMVWGFSAPLMLQAAVENRVFDTLDQAPATLDQIAAATGASRRGLNALLNGLVGLQLLQRQGERFSLPADVAAFLVRGKPGFLGGMLQHLTGQALDNWQHLSEIVRTGRPAATVNQQGQGAEFFSKFVEDLFNVNYAGAAALGDEMARRFSGGGAVGVLDIAAGSGVWGIAIAQKLPAAQITAVDWPAVLPITRKVAQRHHVADRLRVIEGDLNSADFGTGYKIATLGHILHSEGEPRSRKLLKKVFNALAPGGIIAIAEFMPDDDRQGPAYPLIFGVNMLVHTDEGDSFTFQQLSQWLTEAGFKDIRKLDVPAPSPLVMATRPK